MLMCLVNDFGVNQTTRLTPLPNCLILNDPILLQVLKKKVNLTISL